MCPFLSSNSSLFRVSVNTETHETGVGTTPCNRLHLVMRVVKGEGLGEYHAPDVRGGPSARATDYQTEGTSTSKCERVDTEPSVN